MYSLGIYIYKYMYNTLKFFLTLLHFILIYKKVNKQPFVTGVCSVFLLPPHTHSQPHKQKQPERNTPA